MYIDLEPLERYWFLDIETESLTPKSIHCMVVKNAGTSEVRRFTPALDGYNYTDIGHFICGVQNDKGFLVGHNSLSFDLPSINRICGTSFPVSLCVDTMVLSYLYHPRIHNGHSLAAWGARLNFPKGSYSEFETFTPEMLEYCENDVSLTEKLFHALVKRMAEIGFSERSARLEHRIRHVINKQERNGFKFDTEGAIELSELLGRRDSELTEGIQKLFPPVEQALKVYPYRETKAGVPFASFERHRANSVRIEFNSEGTLYTTYGLREFNPGSHVQRLERLSELGYTASKLTKAGNPSTDEEAVLAFVESLSDDNPAKQPVAGLAELLVVRGRKSMIDTWLSAVNPEDSCIHGSVFSCGAGTRRMTHSKPNTANIPKAKSNVPYGKECRSLWVARPGRVLVGFDATSTQMMGFCHYVNNPDVTKLYSEGDPHQRNADAFGVAREPTSKSIYYSYIFGASNTKLGLICGKSAKFGKFIRNTLLEITPGLPELLEQVASEFRQNNGWLECVDGGYVLCPSEHSALCYKIQSLEGILMKTASVLIDEDIRREGYDALKVGDIHDEGQFDVHPACSDLVGNLCVNSIKLAGESLNLNVPFTGKYTVGETWADTH